eukprot:CAMPEP_0202969324 /NCGR_PEP_ID=MMETSP1396-20130829/14997_1 /ASSEMBLY_ACC=CAM_ASM_000872 /TAXON_ID= /ORGANISM="Pseudokeronopsis sp., Strain Brazil" /LENGTH=55 /DNA_ID=CAMNT_0049696707 /DNA_START=369 /DNA_END=536 /DNA_ORIENTATION=-
MNEFKDDEEKEEEKLKKLHGVPRIYLKEEVVNPNIKALKQMEKAVRIGLVHCQED